MSYNLFRLISRLFHKSPTYVSQHGFDSKAFYSHSVVHLIEERVVHSRTVVRYRRDERVVRADAKDVHGKKDDGYLKRKEWQKRKSQRILHSI